MKGLTNEIYDVIVVGSGPAGLTSAIYTARAGLKTIIYEQSAPGGKLIKTDLIENYPGFETIQGPDLASKMYLQALSLNASVEFVGVDSIFKNDDDIFEVSLANGETKKAYSVILATGTQENKLGIKGEDKLYGKGVSYCAVCDGAFYKNKPVAVVGGGYSAVQEAMYLSQLVDKVYLIVRRDVFRADANKVAKLKSQPNVEFLLKSQVKEIHGTEKVESLTINTPNGEKKLVVSAIFPYIGSTPLIDSVKHLCIENEKGYIPTNDKMQTEIKGLFVAGDVRDVPLRQIAIACGDGAIAGQMAVEYVQEVK
ncbi:thioredoxin-disulfide reductase [Mycoplasma capricolum subsp. capripneumoniae]|uniref:thioredoxin-disulfide reductase n=1 Tax=Mycoplasma capricolum TaxID=2095 RepID=UPI0004EF80F2|nr:thioredoxin-disulfide reductase [Mycoplasma capricolum]QIN47464.1 thioredoxin-disulfide reductase [Mycoplasma capricolum subsp. capripneumoniae]QIN50213.1 thioredoxin-disulfide reductase [Mycoplasma capricolum subsp. capripneumoniae]CEA12251.1 Thioredoxin reductase [Mycoplasma capricolum subsp. capripneumoniae]